jgi:phosphonate transport system substrate-binding protein
MILLRFFISVIFFLLCVGIDSVLCMSTEEYGHAPRVFRIGLVPQDNAVKMVKKWQPLAEYLRTVLHREVELEIEPDYESVIRGLASRKIEIGLLGSFAYVRAAEGKNIVPLARRVIFGSSNYRGVVVVRADSSMHSLADLRGKRFAFTDKNSTTGYALPVKALHDLGYGAPQQFFSEVIFTGNHDSALLAVYSGSADGAALSTTRFDPRNLKLERLRIIWQSETIPLGPFVARKDLGEQLLSSLRRAFLRIGTTEETKPLLKQFGVDGFVPAYERDYRVVKKLLKSLEGMPLGE